MPELSRFFGVIIRMYMEVGEPHANGADFDPATLHDWPEFKDALATRAREWERAPAHG